MLSASHLIEYLILLMVRLIGATDLYPITVRTSQKTILPISPIKGIDRLISKRVPT